MRRIVAIGLAAAAVPAGLLVLASFARSVTYPAPPVAVPSPPPEPLEEVRLELGTGGTAWAWLLAPADLPAGAPVVLFFHGNGENLETMRRAGLFEELRHLEIVALAVDYPGYGRSPGRTGERGVLATGEAALVWAREHHAGRPVVLAGWSLGAAVALDTASHHPEDVAGLVAMSPWTRLEDVAAVHFPRWLVRWALPERYDSLAAIRGLEDHAVPALVIHGARDAIIPADQGRRIADALEETVDAPVRWVPVPDTGHNDLLARGRVWRELRSFLDAVAEPTAH